MCSVSWEMDGTPQQVSLTSQAAKTKLLRHDNPEFVLPDNSSKPHEVFVQHGKFLMTKGSLHFVDDVFIPPCILGGNDSSTMWNAFLHSMKLVGLDLWNLGEKFTVAFLCLTVDGAPTNALVADMLQEERVCFCLFTQTCMLQGIAYVRNIMCACIYA